jgi:hypothetical protein
MTLDAVEIDLSRVFEFGQAYVALSRATSVEAIVLREPFKAECVKAHPDVVQFYQQMARKAKSATVEAVQAGAGVKRAGATHDGSYAGTSPPAKKPTAVSSVERLLSDRALKAAEPQARRKLEFFIEGQGL